MKDFVYQVSQNECGYAALKMLLCMYAKDSRYLYLTHPHDLNHAYSLLELKEIAKKHGLLLGGYIIKNKRELFRVKTPFILIKTLENGNKHAVVIKKLNSLYAYVYDPDLGKKYIRSKKLLENLDSGVEALIVEGYSDVQLDLETEPLVTNKNKLKIYALEVLSVLMYFASAYFVEKGSNFLYPVILISLGVLLAIGYRISTYKIMEQFDDNFIRYTYDNDKKEREEKYRLMHNTKSGILSTNSNIIVTLLSAIAVNTILILNNYYSVFVLGVSILLVIIDSMIVMPKVKNMMSTLSKDEQAFLSKKNIDENQYENDYLDIKESAYKIAKMLDLKKVVNYFVILMVVLFVSAITENANIFFVLFYLAMSIYTYNSLDNVFNMIDHNKENLINQTKFYELINKNEFK